MSKEGKIVNDPYLKEVDTLLEELKSSTKGLDSADAERRFEVYGPNEIPEFRRKSIFKLLLKQFISGLVFILLIAAAISWWAGEMIDTWVIIAVVFINAAIGFSQEYRAEKAIASLRKKIVKMAKVLRDGHLVSIPTIRIVPGDVIFLEEGDNIAADARVIESKNLRCNESTLTGESIPSSKTVEKLNENCSLADQKNMIWKGTFIAGGYAYALVTGTGTNTAIGGVSEMLGEIKTKRSNFLVKTDILARQMAFIAIVSAGTLFLVGYFYRGFEIHDILLTSIAALVAAVPEGLPAVITIVLAIGANRMAKRNALIREFNATETLGAVSAILTDKTGTLTQNTLTVRKVFIPFEEEINVSGDGWFPAGNFMQNNLIIDANSKAALKKLLKIAGFSNNSMINHNVKEDVYELIGDPTEGALLVLARKGEINPQLFGDLKLDDLPFDSQLKLRASLIKECDTIELYVSGAPEQLLERSANYLSSSGEAELSNEKKLQIKNKISEWSDNALRVIGLTYKETRSDKIAENKIDHLVFVGLAGMIDPPRPDAREAVEKCKKAGIRVIMVTGDHVNTALAIARKCGIISDGEHSDVIALNEQQLLQLDEQEFKEAIKTISVFARLSPAMKLRIAGELQAMGHLIAMTGDGINDAPALKKADVGISMGIMGTDVARDSSDVVLADDNFASIVNAVEEGRIIFANSRQTGIFLVTTNMAESVTLIAAIALGLPLPLTATQLLWLNLVTDGVNDMALATEAGHGEIMKAKVFQKNENILNKNMLPFLLINVLLMTAFSLATFFHYIDDGIEKARTGVFMVMAFTQLFNVFNMRSIKDSVFRIGLFSNSYINVAVFVSILMLLLLTEIPFMAAIFNFHSIELKDLLILFAFSSTVLWAGEFYKFIKYKRDKS